MVVAGGGELAGGAVGGLGGDFVYGSVWVGGGVFVVLLAAAVSGGFAVERVYVLAASAGDDSGDFDAWGKGIVDGVGGRRTGVGRGLLDGIQQGVEISDERERPVVGQFPITRASSIGRRNTF